MFLLTQPQIAENYWIIEVNSTTGTQVSCLSMINSTTFVEAFGLAYYQNGTFYTLTALSKDSQTYNVRENITSLFLPLLSCQKKTFAHLRLFSS